MYKIIHNTCGCDKPQAPLAVLKRLVEEIIEVLGADNPEHKREEISDAWMMASEILFSITGGAWKWVLPGANDSYLKGVERRKSHGCCRSLRNSCKKAR